MLNTGRKKNPAILRIRNDSLDEAHQGSRASAKASRSEFARLVRLEPFFRRRVEARAPACPPGVGIDAGPASQSQRQPAPLRRVPADNALSRRMGRLVSRKMCPAQPLGLLPVEGDAGLEVGVNEDVFLGLPVIETRAHQLEMSGGN